MANENTAEKTLRLLEKLSAEFDQHRTEAKIAMQKVDRIDTNLGLVGPNIGHLQQLPLINDNLIALRTGLVDQNKSLMSQNGVLIAPNARAQSVLAYIILATILAMFLLMAFILLREYQKDVTVTGSGFTITSPHQPPAPQPTP